MSIWLNRIVTPGSMSLSTSLITRSSHHNTFQGKVNPRAQESSTALSASIRLPKDGLVSKSKPSRGLQQGPDCVDPCQVIGQFLKASRFEKRPRESSPTRRDTSTWCRVVISPRLSQILFMDERDEFFWLVGLLEGEGSFMPGPPSEATRPRISIQMTDENVIRRVARIFGKKYF